MKNWLKILKFTLQQAIKGKKFISTTVIIGIVIFIAAAASKVLIAGAFDKDAQINDLKNVFIVNETDLSLDTDSFIEKHKKDYPYLTISEVTGMSAEDAAKNPDSLGEHAGNFIVLEIAESKDTCDLTVYVPSESTAGGSDGSEFAWDFSDAVKKAKIKNTGISEGNLNIAISDLHINEVTAEEADEAEEETNALAYLVPLMVIMVLYFLVLFYGQSIGQIISMEKTSKLMEYLLTLAEPSGIIFGKVTAIFCEAVLQLFVWIVCGSLGLLFGDFFVKNFTSSESPDFFGLFVKMLPEGSFTKSFILLAILSLIALLVAFLFYSCVSALFASFAATPEDLTQTTGISVMIMLFGFFGSMYIPPIADNSKLVLAIIRIIPFTSAFTLPGDVLCAKIGLVEYVVYLTLLIAFSVLVAMIAGRVYKYRLFKKGTKGLLAEIGSAITGKTFSKSSDEDNESKDLTKKDTATSAYYYEKVDKAKKAYTIAGFALLVLLLCGNAISSLVAQVLGQFIAAHKHIDITDVYSSLTFSAVINIIGIYVIAVPAFALIMQFSNDSLYKVKGHISKSQYLRAIFIIFPVTYVLSLFSNYLASLLTDGEAQNTFINNAISGSDVLTMIMVAVLAPIFEELVFRKILIDRIRRYGEFMAIFFSAFAFGMFHSNLYQIFYAFAIGIILGYVYVRTGNVILTIIMHMIVNASSSVLAPLAPAVYEYFYYAMLGLGIVSLIYTLIKRDIKFEHTEYEIKPGDLSSIAFINVGTILFTLICILFAVYKLLFN